MYLYIAYGTGFEKVSVYVNGEIAIEKYYGNHNKMIQLGKHKKGEKVRIEFTKTLQEFRINQLYVYYENEEALTKKYERLSSNQVELKKHSDTKYEGVVDIKNSNNYIMFMIPYDEGWKIKIDGKKAEVIEVQEVFMAVKCEEGSHKIEMKFTPRGLKTGMIMSFSGIVIILVYCLKKKS